MLGYREWETDGKIQLWNSGPARQAWTALKDVFHSFILYIQPDIIIDKNEEIQKTQDSSSVRDLEKMYEGKRRNKIML